jgi:hypothetical protein
VDGPIRSIRGTGERGNAHKLQIQRNSSLFGEYSVPRAELAPWTLDLLPESMEALEVSEGEKERGDVSNPRAVASVHPIR